MIEPDRVPLPTIVNVSFSDLASANRKVTVKLNRVGTRLYNLRRMKSDQRILLHVEKVLAPQLAILHTASGIHAVRLDPNVQNR